MLTIRQIDQRDYPTGKKAMYKYQSDKYYEVQIEKVEMGWSLSLNEKSFTTPFVKELEGGIFEPYKEGSEVYVADFNGEEAAVMVVKKMEWNNTLLIHDIYVDSRLKNKGIGSKLIGVAKKRANELGSLIICWST